MHPLIAFQNVLCGLVDFVTLLVMHIASVDHNVSFLECTVEFYGLIGSPTFIMLYCLIVQLIFLN